MAQVTVHEAKTHLSRLIHRAQAGEEVIIARGDKPVVRLVAVDGTPQPRRLGGAPGLVEYMAEDFNAEIDDFRSVRAIRLLIDTQVFLWSMDAPQKLSAEARSFLESSEHDLFLSAASYWEICIKVSIGKLRLASGWQATADREMTRNRVEWLPIDKPHLQRLIDLPWIHRDPFDRLLVAQAMVGGMSLLTSDRNLDRYPVETCW